VSFMASTISLGTPSPMAADIFEIPMPMKPKLRPQSFIISFIALVMYRRLNPSGSDMISFILLA